MDVQELRTTLVDGDEDASPAALRPLVARTVTPIRWWAALGTVFIGLWIYLWGRWVTSGAFKNVPAGPTEVPGYMKGLAVFFTLLGFGIAGVAAYFFLVKPWRAHGTIGLDGFLLLAFQTMLWQDCLANYFTPLITYNAWLTNFGSWYEFIPGWMSPNGNRIATPVLWDWPLYFYFWLPATMLGCYVMRRARRRWPQLGRVGQALACYLVMAALDFVLEVGFWTRAGMYGFPGASGPLVIFEGHYYQFPIYESVLVAGVWTAFACIREFKDASGRTAIERGIDRIRGSARKKRVLRFLALAGAVNLVFLAYNGAIATIGIYQHGWSADVQKRSYLTSEQCGEGTDFACPQPGLPPLVGPDTVHVGSNNQVVIPPGVTLRPFVPFADE